MTPDPACGRDPQRRYLQADADISEDGRYRYALWRRLSMGEREILFVGLNPSTADATNDDPTIRKCVHFARREGFDWLLMANLNAWRSTNPKLLPRDSLTAVGPRNQDTLNMLAQRAEIIIAAWGNAKLNHYAATLGQLVLARPNVRVLGQNQNGTPKHPLYLRNETRFQELQ